VICERSLAKQALGEFFEMVQCSQLKPSWGLRFGVEVDDSIDHSTNVFHELDTFIFAFFDSLEPV
jgi:hypothetical protein